MKIDVRDDDQVRCFIESVQKTEPEITSYCDEVIAMMRKRGDKIVPKTRIKRLATERTDDYRASMKVAVAVAASPLVSTLVHGETGDENLDNCESVE